MYKLSNLAAEDFAAIYEYTLLHFGAPQADAYTTHLESNNKKDTHFMAAGHQPKTTLCC